VTASDPRSVLDTHRVENQPGARPVDLWDADPALRAAVAAAGADAQAVAVLAHELASPEAGEAARAANRHPPELRLFDRAGRRLDEVAYHPAYHRLLGLGLGAGYAAVAWEGGPGGHATHAAMVYLFGQIEPGVCCPMTMTYAAIPALRADPGLAAAWEAALRSRRYDPSARPVARKTGATMGMAMTEKQGGSDVRSNATRARADGPVWRLTGHKWFCSAPMSDAFLTLAQTPGGLSCFLVPRWTEEGRNRIDLMRLKDKLGNRANASAEIEFRDTAAHLLGEEGNGLRTILEMVHHTRLDTAMAPAALMRAALAEAVWWCRGRRAFGTALIDAPLMRAVLAELALDAEGALALGMRVAEAFDGAGTGRGGADRGLARIGVALAKFLSNKRAPGVVVECMEALGGMGYVEDTPLPLLYREAPLNSIWEGSGNVICLDILRSLDRDPEAAAALAEELDAARGGDRRYDAALRAYRDRWPGRAAEAEARLYAERAASLLTASVLIRRAPPAVAEGYVAARLMPAEGRIAGGVAGLDSAAILSRFGAD
jgi:putative acyl-CoA dehydrogenase